MKTVYALIYSASDAISFDITKVVVVSRNKKQLESLVQRLKRFTPKEDDFSVVKVLNPIIKSENGTYWLLYRSKDDSDEVYTFVKNYVNNISEEEALSSEKIHSSLTKADIRSAFSYIMPFFEDHETKELALRKINKAKKSGEYYLNPENYKKYKQILS